MDKILKSVILLFAGLALLAGCAEGENEGSGTLILGQDIAVLLPPGHPGTVSGNTLILPAESTQPLVRYANCFAGVNNLSDFGIGSSAGATKDYLGFAMLPVNINLGDTVLGAYRIRLDVSDPSVRIDLANVSGSNYLFSRGSCNLRDCLSGCEDFPGSYPPQFDRAAGFESIPSISGTVAGVTIEAVDGDAANPTTGVVNLCNVRVNIVADLPSGGVDITFTVDLLEDPLGQPIINTPLSGIIIKNFQIQ